MHKTNYDLTVENTKLQQLEIERLNRRIKELETKPTEKIVLGL